MLAGLNRLNDGVPGRVKVFGGVLVLRRIAAAHVAADFAETQVHPTVGHFETFFASMCLRLYVAYLVKMGTLRHCFLISIFTACFGSRTRNLVFPGTDSTVMSP